MDNEKKRGSSFFVLLAFIILFLIFLYLDTQKKTGSVVSDLTGTATLGSGSSGKIILVIVIIVVVLGLGIFFTRYKKNKKMSGQTSLIETKKIDLSEEEIEKLFSERNNTTAFNTKEKFEGAKEERLKSEQPKAIEISPTNLEKIQPSIQKSTQKPLREEDRYKLNLLKKEIRNLTEKGLEGEQILDILIKKNYLKQEIEEAIKEVNFENLKSYINKTLEQGFDKSKMIKALINRGWPKWQIDHALSELGKSTFKTSSKFGEEIDLDLI